MLRAAKRLLASGEDGFTLVELLIVMLIMTVVGAIVGTSVIGAYGGTRRAQDRTYAIADVQKGQERLTRELRAAYGLTSQSVTFDAVEIAEPNRVRVNVLRNGGRIRFTYYIQGGALRETREVFADVAAATATTHSDTAAAPFIPMVMNEEVGLEAFTYYSQDGEELVPPIADSREITRIAVRLVRDLPEQGAITVETQANLRNSRE